MKYKFGVYILFVSMLFAAVLGEVLWKQTKRV